MKIPYRSLTFWIFVGLFGGIVAGRVFGESIVPIANPLSVIFLRLLRMAIMPLIITSLTAAVISVGGRRDLGILGAKTFAYYVTSSLLAILTGQTLVNLLKPGVGSAIEFQEEVTEIAKVLHAAVKEVRQSMRRENTGDLATQAKARMRMLEILKLLEKSCGQLARRLEAGDGRVPASLVQVHLGHRAQEQRLVTRAADAPCDRETFFQPFQRPVQLQL